MDKSLILFQRTRQTINILITGFDVTTDTKKNHIKKEKRTR